MFNRTVKQLIDKANRSVTTISADEAAQLAGDPNVLFVDLREPDELAKSGTAKGAVHVPRGLLEFRADPLSPVHQPELGRAEQMVLFCGSGGRSALAAKSLQDMGFDNVVHVAGGFPALKAAGVPVADVQRAETAG